MLVEGWSGRWIWQRPAGPANTWMRFRKSFFLPAKPKSAVARIAADSKYWLWVNGQLAVREGALRRGPTRTSSYFDEIDLARYLRRGKNVIAVLVWYWGREGFSHNDSGAGGLLFEMTIGAGKARRHVVSDATWRASPHPAFLPAGQPNYRLPEWCIRFDARRDQPSWQQPPFSDRSWSAAAEKEPAGEGPWGGLEPRPVPFWKDYGLKRYSSVKVSDGAAVCKLPYNVQLNTYLAVDSPPGREIKVTTDHSYLGPLEWTYITRSGRQEWECPWWLNGEQVRYEIPESVKVLALKYRQTGVNADFAGAFSCPDERLDALWEKARRTTYLCLRDNYMDCPDRERAQWWGDAVNEVLQTFYGFSPAAYAHARKGMLEVARWQRPSGVIYSPVPSGNFNQELPCQMLAGVWIMWQYYLYTGDRGAIAIVYPHVRRYLQHWQKRKDERGFVVPQGEWVWIDWGERQDGYRIANALYVIALDSAVGMANLLGRRSDVPMLLRWRNGIARRFARELWTGRGFGADDRANALALLAGLVLPAQRGPVKRLLETTENASPYMERYVEEALFRLGEPRSALARMRRRYAGMIDHTCTTLWEGWSWKQGELASNNHAWAGGPLYLLSAYVAGVRPTEPGFRRFQVTPMLGDLRRVDCTVPTVRGTISVAIEDDKDALCVNLRVPRGSAARVGLPTERGGFGSVRLAGRSLQPEQAEGRAWVEVGPGEHRIIGRR